MISQGVRAFARLSQLTSCLENRRLALLPWTSERVAAFYSINIVRHGSDSHRGKSSIVPVTRRAYATTGKPVSRPKAHTGRTTASPRKKAAPKTTAAKKAAPKTTTAKKPAAAKKATKPKPKPKAKPKKPKAKPKPKRKVLTEKQKAKRAATKESLGLKNLKEVALNPPKALPATAWFVFIHGAREQGATSQGHRTLTDVHNLTKEAAQRYKNLTPEQLEHYNHLANENKTKNQANYRKWIESYTPAQIRQANYARLNLRRRSNKPRSWPQLHDERQVKSSRSAYVFFFIDRTKSGDFHGIKPTEATKIIAKEWKALSADEAKKYKDMAAQDMARYEQEQKAVYNLDVTHVAGSPQT